MRRLWPGAGALAVLALLVVASPLGLFALAAVVMAALATVTIRGLRMLGSRRCTRCGLRVRNGELDCPHCGFDFRSIGAG